MYLIYVLAANYFHPKSDKSKISSDPMSYPDNTIRIEVYQDLSGKDDFFGTRISSGLIIWRDYINNQGGLCLLDTGGTNECLPNERRLISMKIIDWARGADMSNKVEYLYRQSLDICKRDKEKRPHFIVGPYSLEYSFAIHRGLVDSTGDENKNCYIPVFFNSNSPSFFLPNDTYQFSLISPITSGMESAIEFFSLRNNARTYVILSSHHGNDFDYAQIAFDTISSHSQLELLMKRCNSSRTDHHSFSCRNDDECPNNEKCSFAFHDGDVLFPSRYLEFLRRWLTVIIDHDPDVVVLTEIDGISTMVELAQEYRWSPRAVVVLSSAGLRYYDSIPSIHWTYLSQFTQLQNKGIPNVYMGTTEQYLQYAKPFVNDTLFGPISTAPPESQFDFEFIGLGSAIGITIQRGIEFASQGLVKYDPDDPFTELSYMLIKTAFTYFGECGFNKEVDGRISITGILCRVTEDCNGVQCYPWENFYGIVHFDSNGVNSQSLSMLIQIYNDSGSLNTKVIGPSSNDECNKNGDCEQSRGYDCTCPGLYPSPFYWLPVLDAVAVPIFTPNFYVTFVIAIIIFIFYLVSFIWLESNTDFVIIAELPPLLRFIPVFSILSLVNVFFYSMVPTTMVCFARTITYIYTAMICFISDICVGELLLAKKKNRYVDYTVYNTFIFIFFFVILLFLTIIGLLAPTHVVTIYYISSNQYKKSLQCEQGWLLYVSISIVLFIMLYSLKSLILLYQNRQDKASRMLSIIIGEQIVMSLVICWILDMLVETSSTFYFIVGIIKCYAFPVTISPFYIYIFNEYHRRIKMIEKLHEDSKFIESILAKPITRTYLREYLKDCQFDHYVDCYLHISIFRDDDNADNQDYEDFIYDTYCGLGQYNVGLTPNLLEDLSKKQKKGDRFMFDKVQKAIINVLQLSGKVKSYLFSHYSEYARRLQVLGTSLKSYDTHVMEVIRDNLIELLSKRKKRMRNQSIIPDP